MFVVHFLSVSEEPFAGGVPRGLGLPRGGSVGTVGNALLPVGGRRTEKRPSFREKTFTASSQIAPMDEISCQQ